MKPFDTVKDLQDFLSTFPNNTPVTVSYDGTGRVGGVASHGEGDVIACVAVFPVTDHWLAGNDLSPTNPRIGEEQDRG